MGLCCSNKESSRYRGSLLIAFNFNKDNLTLSLYYLLFAERINDVGKIYVKIKKTSMLRSGALDIATLRMAIAIINIIS